VSWRLDDFERSLTSVRPATVAAYRRDLTGFVTWAERAGTTGPDGVDRLVLRRYLAYLTTRRYARRSIARGASS
jgi:integrase/recombinase XerC